MLFSDHFPIYRPSFLGWTLSSMIVGNVLIDSHRNYFIISSLEHSLEKYLLGNYMCKGLSHVLWEKEWPR